MPRFLLVSCHQDRVDHGQVVTRLLARTAINCERISALEPTFGSFGRNLAVLDHGRNRSGDEVVTSSVSQRLLFQRLRRSRWRFGPRTLERVGGGLVTQARLGLGLERIDSVAQTFRYGESHVSEAHWTHVGCHSLSSCRLSTMFSHCRRCLPRKACISTIFNCSYRFDKGDTSNISCSPIVKIALLCRHSLLQFRSAEDGSEHA